MSEEILINGKKITELSDMFFEYCKLIKKYEELYEKNVQLKKENEELRESLKTWQYSDQQHLLKIIKYEKTFEEIRDLKVSQGIKDDVLKMIDEVLNEK